MDRTMDYDLTTQGQVRAAFWQGFPTRPKKWSNGQYPTTIRCEFVDFVDMLQKGGHISEALAQRVTLEGR